LRQFNPPDAVARRTGVLAEESMETTSEDTRTLRAAAFFAQALELDAGVDPVELAGDLSHLKDEPPAAIYAAELDSSIGPAAFLIYVYAFEAIGPDGRPGRALFDADLAILETAAERDAPGPRLVAHALTADEGYILATTPATLRALRGEAPTEAIESLAAGPGDLLPTGELAELRQAAAGELLRLLTLAEVEATSWLSALQAEGRQPGGASDAPSPSIEFNEAETELALFLLDERSIQSLLRALNLLLTAAREGASQALGRDEPADR
jgi:hypothetical protein